MPAMHSGEVSVLVVEDHPAVRKSVRLLLCESGFRVAEACDGADALTQCQSLLPCVAVLDISMPHLNGFECAREIEKISPQTRIIFLTSHACDEYARAALFRGGTLILKKDVPFDLVAVIDAVLEGKGHVSSGD